jgi:hypothetical protein
MTSGTQRIARRRPPGRLRPCTLPQVRTPRLGGLPHQLQLGRQGEGMQVVSLDDSPPCSLSQGAERLRARQCVHHGIGDRRGIEKIDQESVFTVAQDLLNRWRSGAHYQTPGRQSFQHRPGEDEGIGKINVHAGDLEHGEEGRIGHSSHEVHAAHIERIAELFQHLLPVGFAARQSHPVADLIAPHDYRLSLGPSGEDRRETAHETPESTVRFEIARHVGDDLIVRGELTIRVGQRKLDSRIGFHDSRVDPLVDDPQHRVVPLGIERLLPARGALPEVCSLETQEIADVLGPKSRSGVELLGNARLEFDIGAFRPVEKLEIADERDFRVDIFQVPDLAPAVVAEHDVGYEAGLLERQSGAGDLLAVQHSRLGIPQVVMRLRGRFALRRIHDLLDARQRAVVALSEKDDLITALSAEMTCQVNVLTGEVLMSEQDSHGRDWSIPADGVGPVRNLQYRNCDCGWRSKMLISLIRRAESAVRSLGQLRWVKAGLYLCLALAAFPLACLAQETPSVQLIGARQPCRPDWLDRRAVPVKITDSLILSVPVKYIRYELLTCGADTNGIPRDGPPGSALVSFDFFMPDFSGYTIARLRQPFDVNEVHVAYVTSPKEIEPHHEHPTNYPSNQLRNVLRYLANPREYQDMYGLRCYEDRILKDTIYCYSAQAVEGHEGLLLKVMVPPYALGVVNPQMTTEYFSNRYGGVEVAWRTNVKNLPRWREINDQVWKFIAAWNVAHQSKAIP